MYKKVHEISRRWARYRLSLQGGITIPKNFLIPKFIYVVLVLDSTYENINKMIPSFINTGSTLTPGNGNSSRYPIQTQIGRRFELYRYPELGSVHLYLKLNVLVLVLSIKRYHL